MSPRGLVSLIMAKNKGSKSKTPKKGSSNRVQDLSALSFPAHLQENEIIEELRQTVQKLRIYYSLGKTLTSSLDLSEVLRIVVEKLGGLIQCRHFALVLLDETSNHFYFEFPKPPHDVSQDGFPLGRGIIGHCLERGKGDLFQNPLLDPLFDARIDGFAVEKPSSMMTLPIMSRGTVLGLLAFFTSSTEPSFGEDQFRLVETFSDYLAIAVENARNYRQVQELTVSDDLTKLYNGRYLHLVLERELARSERYKENLSLVFIDLDNFKQINDQHGHMVGSQLLREFGEFLLSGIRTSDVAIRYGGDEFVLVLPRTTKKDALQFVNRMLDQLRAHVFLKSKHLTIKMTASFGISCSPEDGKNIDQLISAADRAMYIVKKGSKNGVYTANQPITLIGSRLKS